MEREPRVAAAIVEGGISGLILLTPFFYGGVQGWIRGVVPIVAAVIVIARLVERRSETTAPAEARRAAVWIGIPAGLFVVLALFQILPLPRAVLGVLAPGSHRLYEAAVPGYAEGAGLEGAGIPSWLLDRPRTRDLLGEEENAARAPEVDMGDSPFDVRFSTWRSASIVPYETARRLSLLVACLAIAAVTAGHYRSEDRVRRLGAMVVISGLAAATFTTLHQAGWVGSGGASLVGPFVNRNTYAAFVGAIVPVAIGLALASFKQRRIEGGLFWSLSSILLTAAVFFSLSRGGILSWAVSVTVLVILIVTIERRMVAVATLGALLAASVLFLAWLGPGEVLDRIATISEGSGEPSLGQRIDVWKRSLGVVGDYPGVGSGLGTFAYAFMRHAPPEEAWWRDAHNEYLELLCDTGMVGGVIVIWALAAFLVVAFRPARTIGHARRLIMIGAAAGLLSVAVHSAVSTNLQIPAVALLAATLAGALVALTTTREPHADSAHRSAGRPGILAAGVLVAAIGVNAIWGTAAIAGFFHRNAGEEALARASMDRAVERLTDAAWWQPGDARTYELIARAVELSLSNGLDLTARGADGPDALLGFGLGALAAGLDRNPGNARTWFAVATLYQGRRARRDLTRAIAAAASGDDETPRSLVPEDPVSIGAILMAQQLQPEFTTYYDYLAGILMRGGLGDEAYDQLRHSFTLRPYLAGHSLIDIDDESLPEEQKEAILEGIEAAEPDPYTPPLLAARSRARLLENMGRIDDAFAAFVQVKELGEDNEAEFQFALGRLYQKRGDYADSVPKLEVAAQMGRGTEVGAWAVYHLGLAMSRLGQHTAAIRYYRTFLNLKPDHFSAYTGLAGELDLVGQTEEAEGLYREAVERFPDETIAYQKMIAFLERQSREDEAERFREELRRLAP